MTWHYDFEPSEDGFIVVERFGNKCYSEQTKNSWWNEYKEGMVVNLKMMIADLEKHLELEKKLILKKVRSTP